MSPSGDKTASMESTASTESMMQSLDWYPIIDGPKREAPEIVVPRGDPQAREVHEALRQSRADLHAALRTGDRLALGEVTATHPVLGVINVYQWVLFIGQHETRHTRQVAEIVRQLG
jgi:uncharacterized damage-inducible protein DinB